MICATLVPYLAICEGTLGCHATDCLRQRTAGPPDPSRLEDRAGRVSGKQRQRVLRLQDIFGPFAGNALDRALVRWPFAGAGTGSRHVDHVVDDLGHLLCAENRRDRHADAVGVILRQICATC